MRPVSGFSPEKNSLVISSRLQKWSQQCLKLCSDLLKSAIKSQRSQYELKYLKGLSSQKWKFRHQLLTLKLLQTCVNLFFFCWTQKKIFWRMIGSLAPLTSIVFYYGLYYGSQWCQTNVWFQSFFKISSFVFSRRKKLVQVCNNLRLSKLWQKFSFLGGVSL